MAIERESCESWTEVPGGYTLFLSVFDQKDPNFATAYSLVPEFDYKLPTNKSVPVAARSAQSKVVCINRISTVGLNWLEPGACVENSIKLSSTSPGNRRMESNWPKDPKDCSIAFASGSPSTCDIGYDGGAENIN